MERLLHSEVISSQLSLGLELEPTVSFDNFYISPKNSFNQKAMQHLKELLDKKGEKIIYFYGPPGAGKTHLLQAACVDVMKHHESAIYVSLKKRSEYHEEMLQNLESLSLICIDDLESIAGDDKWEEALFHLYNAIFTTGARLILAGTALPNKLNLNLDDLVSRLAWSLNLKIEPLVDQEAWAVLENQAQEIGLKFAPKVKSFLLQHSKRDIQSLSAWVKLLKKISMETRRPVTVPLIKKLMGVI